MKEGMVIIIGGSGHMEKKGDMSMGGEEMNVYGYDTQNFHICPGAKESFEQLVKAGY